MVSGSFSLVTAHCFPLLFLGQNLNSQKVKLRVGSTIFRSGATSADYTQAVRMIDRFFDDLLGAKQRASRTQPVRMSALPGQLAEGLELLNALV